MKQEEKLVRKWLPVCPWDMGGVEHWLEQMAAQGLFLAKPVSVFAFLSPLFAVRARFSQGTPKPYRRYRLFPVQDFTLGWYNDPAFPELRELYEDAGWTYAASFANFFYVFYSDDPSAVEPHTDPDSWRRSLDKPTRWLVLFLVLDLIALAISCATAVFTSNIPRLITNLCISLLWLLWLSVNLYALHLTRKRLREGSLQRNRPLPRILFKLSRSAAMVMIVTFLITLTLLPGLIGMSVVLDGGRKDLNDWDPEFPLLTLAPIEGDGSWTPYPDFDLSQPGAPPTAKAVSLHFNTVDISRSPISPTVRTTYDIYQWGEGNSGSSSLDILYQVCASPEAALDRQEALDAESLTPLDGIGADYFAFFHTGRQWHVLARDGERVLELNYMGNRDLAPWFDEIVDMLTEIES